MTDYPQNSPSTHTPNPSIESYGGIIPFLDATAHKHTDPDGIRIDAKEFQYRLSVGVPETRLARDMGVVPNTVKNWRKRLGGK